MPTYEYKCAKCGDRLEVFQRISDSAPDLCERCGGKLKKVFFPVGIVFKGSGFYCTDSRKPGVGNGKCASGSVKTDGGADVSAKDAGAADDNKDASAKASKETTPASPAD